MIDEELYQQAAEELNSDKRRPHLWARACALASDDHDEARFLYTNLRVEELLEERAAAENRAPDRLASIAETEDLSLEPLNFEDELKGGEDAAPVSTRTGQSANPSVDLDVSEFRLGSSEDAEERATVHRLADSGQSDALTTELEPNGNADLDLDEFAYLDDTAENSSPPALGEPSETIEVTTRSASPHDADSDDLTLQDLTLDDLGEGSTPLNEAEPSSADAKDPVLAAIGTDGETDLAATHDEDGNPLPVDLVLHEEPVPEQHPDEARRSASPDDHTLTENFDDPVDELLAGLASDSRRTRPSATSSDVDDNAVGELDWIDDVVRSSDSSDEPQDGRPAAGMRTTATHQTAAPDSGDAWTGEGVDPDDSSESRLGDDDIPARFHLPPSTHAARSSNRADRAASDDTIAGNHRVLQASLDDDGRLDLGVIDDSGSTHYRLLAREDGHWHAVREGLNWTAMLFTLPWLLFRQLFGMAVIYSVFAVIVLAGLSLSALALLDSPPPVSPTLMLLTAGFALVAIIGLLWLPLTRANHWRFQKLLKRGFVPVGDVRARSSQRALAAAQHQIALNRRRR